MDIGSILLGILAFVVLLSVIIIIHELGHLITAQKFVASSIQGDDAVPSRYPFWRLCDDGR